jgi:hypothetical protein
VTPAALHLRIDSAYIEPEIIKLTGRDLTEFLSFQLGEKSSFASGLYNLNLCRLGIDPVGYQHVRNGGLYERFVLELASVALDYEVGSDA